MSFSNNKHLLEGLLSKFTFEFFIIAVVLFIIVIIYVFISSIPKTPSNSNNKDNSNSTEEEKDDNILAEIFIKSKPKENTNGKNTLTKKNSYISNIELSKANEILTKANTTINRNLFTDKKEQLYWESIVKTKLEIKPTTKESEKEENGISSNDTILDFSASTIDNSNILQRKDDFSGEVTPIDGIKSVGNSEGKSKQARLLFGKSIKVEYYEFFQIPLEEKVKRFSDEDYNNDDDDFSCLIPEKIKPVSTKHQAITKSNKSKNDLEDVSIENNNSYFKEAQKQSPIQKEKNYVEEIKTAKFKKGKGILKKDSENELWSELKKQKYSMYLSKLNFLSKHHNLENESKILDGSCINSKKAFELVSKLNCINACQEKDCVFNSSSFEDSDSFSKDSSENVNFSCSCLIENTV